MHGRHLRQKVKSSCVLGVWNRTATDEGRTTRGKLPKNKTDEQRKAEELVNRLRKVDDWLRELLLCKFESNPEIQKELGIDELPSGPTH
jgi:hypothetical protein